MYINYFKRGFDLTFSMFGIVLLSIPFLLIILFHFLLYFSNPFFIQQRPGLHGELFWMIKFKTMKGSGLVTAFGGLLRRFSLDELPQLINVIRGDMSLVGPRPLLVEYLKKYNTEQSKRHLVRPGLTGWAQVNGRNLISWEKKFDLDVWYVKNRSFTLDLLILLKTLRVIFSEDGVSPICKWEADVK